MKAEELDRKFDDGEDVLEYFDLETLRRPGLETKLDREAKRLGIPSQAVIKFSSAERSREV